jgi:hypothetical protein
MTGKQIIVSTLDDTIRTLRITRDNGNTDETLQSRIIYLTTLLQRARKLKKPDVAQFAANYGIDLE